MSYTDREQTWSGVPVWTLISTWLWKVKWASTSLEQRTTENWRVEVEGGAGRGVAYGSELGVKHHHLIFTHHSFIYTVMAENYTGLKNPGH